jgi:hypothetical protein
MALDSLAILAVVEAVGAIAFLLRLVRGRQEIGAKRDRY